MIILKKFQLCCCAVTHEHKQCCVVSTQVANEVMCTHMQTHTQSVSFFSFLFFSISLIQMCSISRQSHCLSSCLEKMIPSVKRSHVRFYFSYIPFFSLCLSVARSLHHVSAHRSRGGEYTPYCFWLQPFALRELTSLTVSQSVWHSALFRLGCW